MSYRFGVITAYYSNFEHFVFLSHPLGVLGTMYDVHLGLIEKHLVDFLLVIIELFFRDVTVEAPRAKIDRKSAISLPAITLTQNFSQKGTSLTNHFCMDS